jgi:hypothetical protein
MNTLWIGAVIAAVISSIVTAFGWYVSHQRERDREAARRRDRMIDIQKALRAEISDYALQLREARLPDHLEGIRRAMTADPAFIPLTPRESHDVLFRALVADIHLLPTDAVDPVVRYYSQLSKIAALADDLRGMMFRRLSPERRLVMYEHFIQMKVQAQKYASAAEAALAKGAARAAFADPWLSSRAAARGDPEPAARRSSSRT